MSVSKISTILSPTGEYEVKKHWRRMSSISSYTIFFFNFMEFFSFTSPFFSTFYLEKFQIHGTVAKRASQVPLYPLPGVTIC